MKNIKYSTNIVKKTYEGLGNYLSPSNFTYLWSLGSMALFCLIIQIITGLFLSMFYTCEINMAFISVVYIEKELYYGWLVRYIHMNGASIFFLIVYLHMLKNILYSSYTYPRQILWFTGMLIFLLMIITAFTGYVLPWGQMSVWGATVITSIFSAIPVIGTELTYWLWGGYSVDNATLGRFFSLHFLLPFLIIGCVFLHLVLLHEYGSNNPLGIITRTDNIPFFINYIIKDIYSWVCLLLFFTYFVFFNPNFFGHPDNYILGNFMVTPTQIVPEWYFLPLYAILRSVPNKLGGLIVLVIVFVLFFFIPLFLGGFQTIRTSLFRPFLKVIMPIFVLNLIFLGWIGGQTADPIYIFLGQVSMIIYFLFFVLFFLLNIRDFIYIYDYLFLDKR